jgi:hypothetical protein
MSDRDLGDAQRKALESPHEMTDEDWEKAREEARAALREEVGPLKDRIRGMTQNIVAVETYIQHHEEHLERSLQVLEQLPRPDTSVSVLEALDPLGPDGVAQLLVGMCAQLGRDSVALAVTLETIGEDEEGAL